MWNPFNKKSKSGDDSSNKKTPATLPNGMPVPDMKDMGMLERLAMKRFLAMSPQEQKKMVEKMMTPKNIAKHKDEIMAQLEQARKSGQMSDDQYRLAKKKFGL